MYLHRAEQADGQGGTELEQAQVREPSHPNQQASGHDTPDEPSPSGGDECRSRRVIRLSREEKGEVAERGLLDGLVAVSPGRKRSRIAVLDAAAAGREPDFTETTEHSHRRLGQAVPRHRDVTVREVEHVVVVRSFVEDIEARCVALMVGGSHRHQQHGDRYDTGPGKPTTDRANAIAFALG